MAGHSIDAGSLVAGRFEVERIAGAGGMGVVYKARDRLEGIPVALKVLTGRTQESAERFAREARTLAELSHPGIVRYVAHGRGPGGDPFLAMEWLEGESLAERLARGPFEVGEAVALVARIAEALSLAHRRGVVHRDLKPSNLFLVGGDAARVKVLDFGVARISAGERPITATGALVGTPGYMSPEQAKGARDVDARADVFALGCVLFRCLAGRAAFEGEDVLAVLLKLVLDTAPSVRSLRPEVPPALDALLARMLAREPGERPADAAEVALRLAELGPLSAAETKGSPSLGAGEHRFVTLVLCRLGQGELAEAVLAGAESSLENPTLALGRGAPRPEGSPVELAGVELTMAETLARPVRLLAPAEALALSLRRLVEKRRGRLDVLADSSMLMTFAEGAATDQAASAARGALELMRLVSSTGAERGPAVALVSGRVTSVGGRTMGALIDESVPRLEGAEGILLDEATARLLGPAFEVAQRERGLLLVGERETGEDVLARPGRRTSLVGRDRELALLGSHYRECALEPVARPLVVSGPPGIGKSRLREAFVRKIEAGELGPPPSTVWIGRGDSMTAASPGAMLAAPLLRAAGALSPEAPEVLRERLGALSRRRLSGEAAERVSRLFARLVGLPDEPGVTSPGAEGLGRAFAEFVAAECEAGPFVLVLEDLHFADPQAVELLDVALRELGTKPFFVLALARPDVSARFPDVFAARGVQELRLRELSRRNAERLVRELLGLFGPLRGEDEAAAREIAERGAGNPFYLEELARAHAEGRRELPDTILGTVEARLEQLAPEARRLLRAGSVFGQVFSARGAARLLGGEAPLEWLEALEEAELVVRRRESPRPEYAFRHALVQQAAYATLTAEDRFLGHRLAAAFLEEEGERDALLLAEHLERAGEKARAASRYLQAARASLSAGDLRAAELAARRGAEALGERGQNPAEATEPAAALEQVLAEACRARGDLSSAAAHAARAASLAPPGSETFHAALGELSLASEELGEAGRLDEVASKLGTCCPGPPSPGHALAAARAAIAAASAGRPELFRPLLAAALAAAEEAPRPALESARLRARAAEALSAGDSVRAAGLLEASRRAAEESGCPRLVAETRLALGAAELRIGAGERGAATLARALEDADALGLAAVGIEARSLLAVALARRSECPRARDLCRDALRAALVLGNRIAEGSVRTRLAIVEGTAGDLEAALVGSRGALALLENSPARRAYALAVTASAALALGDVQAALAAAVEARSILDALGVLEEGEALVRLVHAEALAASGRADVARRALALCRTWLLGQASRIVSPELREAFLAGVPEHARIIHLAKTWLGP